jgi:hypothetical protein
MLTVRDFGGCFGIVRRAFTPVFREAVLGPCFSTGRLPGQNSAIFFPLSPLKRRQGKENGFEKLLRDPA